VEGPVNERLPSMGRVKATVRRALESEPRVGVRTLRALRELQSRQRLQSLRAEGAHALRAAPSLAGGTLSVPPASIMYCSLTESRRQDCRGEVLPGDWDKTGQMFCNSELFGAMQSVLKEQSCSWDATLWYAQALARLSAGGVASTCHCEADIQDRLAEVERAYASAQRHNSQAQSLVGDSDLAADGEVGVAIGRSGALMCCDGAHNLGIALLLGLEEVPVRIRVRHPLWAEFRQDLFGYAHSEGGRLYQPALHCDLAGIPSLHSCEDRWKLIATRLDGGSGRVLDIGANLGYFDNKLEDLGYDCLAIESDATIAHFMKGIRDANAHRFVVETGSIFARGWVRKRRFRVVLALSILHHCLKTPFDYASLERLLSELDCDEMFFESFVEDEPQMARAYVDLSPEAFTQHVANRTGLTAVEPLGEAGSGRLLYHLRRRRPDR
jgi:hypothetical protein